MRHYAGAIGCPYSAMRARPRSKHSDTLLQHGRRGSEVQKNMPKKEACQSKQFHPGVSCFLAY